MRKPVWLFSEGSLKRRDLLGNKGANLCEMTSLGMPVPFGFIITAQTHLRVPTSQAAHSRGNDGRSEGGAA